ncbi:MAG: GtrA family protein [Neisseria sp.]|nr:GtrA family protein [Neisseria sp.]
MRLPERDWQRARQPLLFIAVGVAAALCHFLLLTLCVARLHMTPLWGNFIGFCGAFLLSFGGHRYLTFQAASARALRQMLRWAAVSLAGFAANQSLFAVLLAWFGAAHYRLWWLLVTLTVAAATFIIGKYWAFRHEKINH